MEDAPHHGLPDMDLQLVPHIVGFPLILHQRVAAAVAAQAYPLAHLVQRRQMVHPEPVYVAQHHQPFQRPHLLLAQLLLLRLVGLLGEAKHLLEYLIAAHLGETVLGKVGGQGHYRLQLGQQCAQVPVFGAIAGHERLERRLDLLLDHLDHVGADVGALQDLTALGVDQFAMAVHNVVVLDDVLADVKVVALNLGLSLLYRLGDHAALQGRLLIHAHFAQEVGHPVRGEAAHHVIAEGDEEAGAAGVTLTTRPSAELVVDAPRLVALRAHDVQPAGVHYPFVLHLPLLPRLPADRLRLLLRRGYQVHITLVGQLLRQLIEVAAEDDISAAARHVGGDGDGAVAAGLSDDGSLTLVVFGVEDLRLLQGADLVMRPAPLQLAPR